MPPKQVEFDDVASLVGQDLGSSDWHEVTQDAINAFADATLDHQWIHLDQERAEKESPYGTTIAHGYYTLSLLPYLVPQIWSVQGVKMGVNYGVNKVRFPAPVPIGKKVRAHAKLLDCRTVKGGIQVATEVTIEVEGNEKPAAVVEALSRMYN